MSISHRDLLEAARSISRVSDTEAMHRAAAGLDALNKAAIIIEALESSAPKQS